jgi:hypothetical protein
MKETVMTSTKDATEKSYTISTDLTIVPPKLLSSKRNQPLNNDSFINLFQMKKSTEKSTKVFLLYKQPIASEIEEALVFEYALNQGAAALRIGFLGIGELFRAISDTIVGVKGVKMQTLFNLFPTLKTEVLSLDDIITLAKEQEAIRLANKKKPLKALTNIINGVTDGVQGDKLYEINNLLVPYACGVPVVNLHIHSKNLRKWLSNRKQKYSKDLIITGERLSRFENITYIPGDNIDHPQFINYINSQEYNIVLSHNSDYNISEKDLKYTWHCSFSNFAVRHSRFFYFTNTRN